MSEEMIPINQQLFFMFVVGQLVGWISALVTLGLCGHLRIREAE